jgi:LmbE family N-acetylglucosaminyl deacetylase
LAILLLTGFVGARSTAQEGTPDTEGPLRIIAFGAHPDDCELKVGGTAAKWAALGHRVKFVSVTNGDIGHYEMAGGPLAQRRAAEVEAAAEVLGVETQVLDHHDGELMPTLAIRKELIRLVREWEADVVITHRPNDYHPDHRYTSILVQDGAYMVSVPFICPDVPPLKRNPIYLYMADGFQKPYPFQADIAVDIGDVVDTKVEALSKITSQFLEWLPWINHYLEAVPEDAEEAKAFMVQGLKSWVKRGVDTRREALAKWYGEARVDAIEYAEAFEICEYGRQPSEKELRRLFPFFPKAE